MAERIADRLNPVPIDQTSKAALMALLVAIAKEQKALRALLVTKTTITQGEADAVAAVGIKE